MIPVYKVEASCIGPTWARDPETGRFIVPEFSLGWEILHWIQKYLLDPNTGQPFRPTPEQKRFIVWWYAIDERGRFVYRDGVLQRLKGWGKDPLIAVICAVELLGPCRLAGWAAADQVTSHGFPVSRGGPVGKEVKTAWIDVAAVSKEQTTNTMSLFAGMFSEEIKRMHFMNGQSFGKTFVYAHRGQRKIRAVTSNPKTLEGGRATFVVRNETHHWLSSNNGHEMAAVIERNASKSAGGAARALSITNAYDPSENSVAQIQREAWEAEHEGLAIDTGVLYDSLEIPLDYGLIPPELKEAHDFDDAEVEARIRAWLEAIILAVRGDASWLDVERITNSILSRENPPSRSRRFWFNQIEGSEDAWADPAAVDAAEDPLVAGERSRYVTGEEKLRAGWDLISPDDEIVIFGDGSKNDDATGLVGVRLADGYSFTIGVWQQPTNAEEKKHWTVPRSEVDLRVDEAMRRFNVVGFWFDPSHVKDDDGERYWDAYCDRWHRTYGSNLRLWAVKTGNSQHSVMWDMASPERTRQFVEAVERTRQDLHQRDVDDHYASSFTHDGNPALKQHLKNARRHPMALVGGKTGVSIRKENRESAKKIDLAACLIGAQMMRRILLNEVEAPGAAVEEAPRVGWGYAV